MYNLKSLKYGALALTAAALFSGAALAYTYESPSLYDQTEGNGNGIVFVTGGIGEGELAELEYAKPNYNVHITNTDKTGAYVSDVDIVLQDRKGNDVVAVESGPLLFARVPAGRYKVLAEHHGIVQSKSITVSTKKAGKLALVWNVPE